MDGVVFSEFMVEVEAFLDECQVKLVANAGVAGWFEWLLGLPRACLEPQHPSPLLSPHRSILAPIRRARNLLSISPPILQPQPAYHSQNLFTPHRPSRETQPHYAGWIHRRVNTDATGQPSDWESVEPSAKLGQRAQPSHSAKPSQHSVEYERFVAAGFRGVS